MPETTVYLKNYQSPVFTIKTVQLNFELFDDHALVTNDMTVKRQYTGPLQLFGDELELVSLHIDGRQAEEKNYRFVDGHLLIENCPDEATITVVTRIYPQKNSKLSGLYRSNQMFCTQCEAEGFRRITYFPDRPDVLATYTTRICADKAKYPVLLSNGNPVDRGLADGGRHWVVWQDPFKKPCYLFALVAGNLSCVEDQFTTCSGRSVDLRIYVEPGNEDKCSHAMESLKRAMRWDEEEYGREYDLDIFMIVAVSDFNMGAMENKGLNIFNSKYILARPDTATDQDFADIEGVVGHEYFHNWTGNRVTCRDWFQLSLKEGLTVFRDQEFSRDMHARDVNRILDVKVLRAQQFPEDAGSMAHPVRPESYQEINNFYTATVYNKGAEVIRMQQTLLGKAGFRRGMDLYFKRHDGQAVTINDFVAAMEDANQVDLTQFKRWYSQAGTPEITAKTKFKDDCLTLTLSQYCPPTPEASEKAPFHIPVRMACFDEQGLPIPLEKEVLELREQEQTFTFPGLKKKPFVSLLRDFSAPVKLKRDLSQDESLALLRFESDGFAKWDIAQRLAIDCIDGLLKTNKSHWSIPAPLLQASHHVLLDETLNSALRAELLNPPCFEEVTSSLQEIDVDAVEAARDFYRAALGEALYGSLSETYQALWREEKHQMDAQAYQRRKLRNVCLWLMMKAREKETLPLCQQQFAKAKTMTDQMASFALLNNSQDSAVREETAERFFDQWQNDELVLDKWFAVQATGEAANTLERVKQLVHHPAFSLKNPNKVRSLIGAFCMSNYRHFHALNASGYGFLTDILVELDKMNPQVTARLATPFTRLRRFNKPRQELMRNQLERLNALELSRDLKEIVSKSLKD
ncbi:aminopeptidase N [Legionella taurinensis]|uniref:Aminopeptidase N n=1 Tax=Legionella taurinensis TaxID=70611 RepID=A0A3A5L6Q9_9GAMM|nr:aminopeptidase N [Legionella taurinensis]MDX1837767.1 aminopeptidase N [Legionella taurinensis]PUT39725.1 aminopeptidase N [Legionella taurinensis]PUT43418.1 aminopeptidase N [Legionella taurinensis]PUT45864.1 aminopeptidase N [Legionella taurinensis]PUT47776.1 aminopeptidase N [Legionella taurinensis]